MSEPVILNGEIRHCPLKIIARTIKMRPDEQCHYAFVCPTPCTPKQRLAMQEKERIYEHHSAMG